MWLIRPKLEKAERIGFLVSRDELKRLEEISGNKTWREVFLPPLGISTKRLKPGISRSGEKTLAEVEKSVEMDG